MSRRWLLLYTIVVAIVTFLLAETLRPLSLSRVSAQATCQTFPETGKTICGKFLTYWQQHGGLAQQGYPISNAFSEVSDLNGKTYTVQYFERAVFEDHPENQPPYDVLLSQLGTFQFKRKYPNGEPGITPTVPPAPPTPTVGPVSKAELLDYRFYSTEYGTDYTVGQIKNTGNTDLTSVKAIATYKDASNKIVGTGSTTCSCVLRPGEIFPFSIYHFSSDPDFTAVEFQLEYRVATRSDQERYYASFAASDLNVIPPGTYTDLRVLGIIRNTGIAASNRVNVVVLITDAAGKTLDVNDDYTDVSTLDPGQSATFDVEMPGASEAPNIKVFGFSTRK